MNYRFISRQGSRRLILIFAGWGMDSRPFEGLHRSGYDIMVVWDYRSFHIDWSCVEAYDEICLLAWSMGVFAAGQTIHAIDSRITRRVAVNGTLWPIDDDYGIPTAIFRGTLDNLNERNLTKFYRRMCADRATFEAFDARRPDRDIVGLRDELRAIEERMILTNVTMDGCDLAVCSEADAIFPIKNQLASWRRWDTTVRRLPGQGHLVDFQEIIDREFVDKSTMTDRFARGRSTYDGNATVQTEAAGRLIMMAERHCRDAMLECRGNILEVGCGSGNLSRRLMCMAPNARFLLWDIAGDCPADLPAHADYRFERCDAELAINRVPPESLDFIVSASTIQWFNSPDRFLTQCHRALRRKGCLLLTTFCRGNLTELTALTGRSLHLPDAERWAEMGERLFEVTDTEAYTRDIDFATPMDVLRHLRDTGVNSLGSNAGVRTLMERYPMRLDCRYHLTYKPFIMLLTKR